MGTTLSSLRSPSRGHLFRIVTHTFDAMIRGEAGFQAGKLSQMLSPSRPRSMFLLCRVYQDPPHLSMDPLSYKYSSTSFESLPNNPTLSQPLTPAQSCPTTTTHCQKASSLYINLKESTSIATSKPLKSE